MKTFDDLLKSKHRIPKRTLSMAHLATSSMVSEVITYISISEMAPLETAEMIYFCYQHTRKRAGTSLNQYCLYMAIDFPNRSWRYFRALYIIHRHFCVYCDMVKADLIGVDLRMLKFIAEAGINVFDAAMTIKVVTQLKKMYHCQKQKWNYIRQVRDERIRVIKWERAQFESLLKKDIKDGKLNLKL